MNNSYYHNKQLKTKAKRIVEPIKTMFPQPTAHHIHLQTLKAKPKPIAYNSIDKYIRNSMKKYQLWLQRKTYTQHLGNLLRIKLAASERKLAARITTQQQKSKNLSRYQSQVKLTNSFNGEDLCYHITTQQLQKHKLRLVRSKQIVRQNEEMVKRINGAKPFITTARPIEYSHKLKRVRERANVQHSLSQKNRNYLQFTRLYEGMPDPTHRFQLLISFQEVSIRMPHRSQEIMLEIIGTQSLAKSDFIPKTALLGHSFRFTFEESLPDFITLRIHSFKGLQDTVLGDFVIARPEEGRELESEWPTVSMPGVIRGKVYYSRLLPKFWPIKRFK